MNDYGRRAETIAIKGALQAIPLPSLRVKHGTGTAWGWLHVYIGENPAGLTHDDHAQYISYQCAACQANEALKGRVTALVRHVTGRETWHDDKLLVLSQ